MSKKIRLDVLVTERGLCESRQKAQATIMAGLVFVDGQRSDKPGTPVAEDASVEVRGHALRYVSRGGLKLEKAMQTFPITLEGKVCADIGASTGGPQFEAGREKVGKKGVVRDPAVHLEVLENFLRHAKENNFTVLGITYSPIRGPEGNIEYLGYLKKGGEADCVPDLRALVDASHSALKEGHGEI